MSASGRLSPIMTYIPDKPRAEQRVKTFIDRLPEALRIEAEGLENLARLLDEIVNVAGEAWPELFDETRFVQYLADTRRATDALGPSLSQIHAADLCLAWASSEGNAVAIARVEVECFGDLEYVVGRYQYLGKDLADIKQSIRERLFVGENGGAPKIRDYSGKASLRSWLRVVFTNFVSNVAGRASREVPVDDALLYALPDTAEAAEIAHLKDVYSTEFRAAFVNAVERLSSREKNVLRYTFADGLTLDEIAAIYSVHRSSAARWLFDARESLGAAMRADLIERLKLSEHEVASILRLAASRVDITLTRYLRLHA